MSTVKSERKDRRSPAETADRDRRMHELRESGMPYPDIAERFGISKNAANEAVLKYRARLKAEAEPVFGPVSRKSEQG